MQSEQFIVSRISEWTTEERPNNHQNIETASVFLNTSDQFKKLRHIPMSKLSLNNIFVKKQHEKHFYKKELGRQKAKTQHNYFYELRQNFENDITSFVKKYKVSDEKSIVQEIEIESPVPLNMRNSESGMQGYGRGMSFEEPKITSMEAKRRPGQMNTGSPVRVDSKKINEGGYFFNNWRSYEKYFCSKAINLSTMQEDSNQNLAAHLVYAVIDMDYQRGLKIIDRIQEINTMKDRRNANEPQLNGVKIKDIVVEGKHGRNNSSQQKQPKPHFNHISKKSQANSKQSSIHLSSLRIIIKGLRTLSALIKQTDQLNNNTDLAQTFFNRTKFDLFEDELHKDPRVKMNLLNINVEEINTSSLINEYWQGTYDAGTGDGIKENNKFDKKPSYNLSPNSPRTQGKKALRSTENLMIYKNSPKKSKSTEQIKKFLDLSPKHQKICILTNLNFLIKFTSKVKISSCQNDYYKLLFCYIKNSTDQLEEVRMEQYSVTESPVYEGMRSSRYLNQDDDDEFSNMSQTSVEKKPVINLAKEIDYGVLLLELREIKVFDRINFATRLLSRSKKVNFMHYLEAKIVQLPFLDNLLFFTRFYKEELNKIFEDSSSIHYIKEEKPKEQIKKIRKNSSDTLSKYYTQQQLEVQFFLSQKQRKKNSTVQKNIEAKEELAKKIKAICQNFIDEYGDLATIAYLSNDYPCLQKFFDCYRQSLLLSYEQDEVQKIDAAKQRFLGDQWVDKKSHLLKKYSTFLSQINFRTQKLNENPHEDFKQIDSRRCEICSLKIYPDKKECYIECSKCRHGGHLEHLIKWYNSYQNCPNVNCACLCN